MSNRPDDTPDMTPLPGEDRLAGAFSRHLADIEATTDTEAALLRARGTAERRPRVGIALPLVTAAAAVVLLAGLFVAGRGGTPSSEDIEPDDPTIATQPDGGTSEATNPVPSSDGATTADTIPIPGSTADPIGPVPDMTTEWLWPAPTQLGEHDLCDPMELATEFARTFSLDPDPVLDSLSASLNGERRFVHRARGEGGETRVDVGTRIEAIPLPPVSSFDPRCEDGRGWVIAGAGSDSIGITHVGRDARSEAFVVAGMSDTFERQVVVRIVDVMSGAVIVAEGASGGTLGEASRFEAVFPPDLADDPGMIAVALDPPVADGEVPTWSAGSIRTLSPLQPGGVDPAQSLSEGGLSSGELVGIGSHVVVNVGSDDILNVRQGPSVESEAIGSISPSDPRGVHVTDTPGVGEWVEVELADGTGWVNGTFLAEAVVSGAADPTGDQAAHAVALDAASHLVAGDVEGFARLVHPDGLVVTLPGVSPLEPTEPILVGEGPEDFGPRATRVGADLLSTAASDGQVYSWGTCCESDFIIEATIGQRLSDLADASSVFNGLPAPLTGATQVHFSGVETSHLFTYGQPVAEPNALPGDWVNVTWLADELVPTSDAGDEVYRWNAITVSVAPTGDGFGVVAIGQSVSVP